MKRAVGNRQSAVAKSEPPATPNVTPPEAEVAAVSIAWCWRSGEIEIVPTLGTVVPAGAIVIAAGPDERLRAAIAFYGFTPEGSARTYVPGLDGAPDGEVAATVALFRSAVRDLLAEDETGGGDE
jgi:hypothetical protein